MQFQICLTIFESCESDMSSRCQSKHILHVVPVKALQEMLELCGKGRRLHLHHIILENFDILKIQQNLKNDVEPVLVP